MKKKKVLSPEEVIITLQEETKSNNYDITILQFYRFIAKSLKRKKYIIHKIKIYDFREKPPRKTEFF